MTSFLDQRAGLSGKRAIIIGGGGGLGQACAIDLARSGVRVSLCDLNEESLHETEGIIRDNAGDVSTSVLDARDPDALGSFFESTDVAFDGGLDILINVVGGTFRQPFVDSNPRGWDALIRTNFIWLLHAIQLAHPRMERTGNASIVNVTSIEAHRAAPGFAVYAAMKAAVTSLTRSLSLEMAPQGIRINTIAPDYIPTPSLEALAPGSPDEQDLRHQISIPLGRAGSYNDFSGCALFLASDLSSFITGMTLHPDGGALASSGWFNWPKEGYLNNPPADVVNALLGDAD